MRMEAIGWLSCRKPGWIIAGWLLATAMVVALAPDLTRLAAEGQAQLLTGAEESRRAAEMVRECWPDQSYESRIVAMAHRDGGLTEADRRFAARLARRLEAEGRPGEVLRVLGPDSDPEVARRLISPDKTVELVAVSLSSAYVAPATHRAVAWAQHQAELEAAARPAGLDLRWTGDAVIGRDYMAGVKSSLDRAAVATVLLLLVVLLLVYRSFWLSMIPLVTIGVSVAIARGSWPG